MQPIKLVASALVLCVLGGCVWRKQLEFPESGGNGKILLLQPWPANGWGLQVQLCEANHCSTIYSKRGDVFLFFAQVNWADDHRRVSVFSCGEPYLRLAYDRIGRTVVPFASD